MVDPKTSRSYGDVNRAIVEARRAAMTGPDQRASQLRLHPDDWMVLCRVWHEAKYFDKPDREVDPDEWNKRILGMAVTIDESVEPGAPKVE